MTKTIAIDDATYSLLVKMAKSDGLFIKDEVEKLVQNDSRALFIKYLSDGMPEEMELDDKPGRIITKGQ